MVSDGDALGSLVRVGSIGLARAFNCVTSNDNARIERESRCNCLFLGQPMDLVPVYRLLEETVTSELF